MDLIATFPLCQDKLFFSCRECRYCLNLWRLLTNPYQGKAAMKNKELTQKSVSQI